jgi:fucose 4-O-acetylase-like acetyltransferase
MEKEASAIVCQKQRVCWIDLIKLFAIVLVFLNHSLDHFDGMWGSGPLSNFIWLLEMPLFITVSGMLCIPKERASTFKKLISELLKKARLYLYPTFSFILLDCLVFGNYSRNLGNAFLAFFKGPTFWYLWVLFFIILFFDIGLYLSSKIKNKTVSTLFPYIFSVLIFVLLAAVVLFFLKGSDLLGIKLICYYLPFYCFGFLLQQTKVFVNVQNNKKANISPLLFIVSFAIFAIEVVYFKSIFSFPDTSLLFLAIRYIGSVTGVYAVMFSFSKIPVTEAITGISKIGHFTLEFYYLQVIFAGSISSLFSNDYSPTNCLILFLLYVVVCALCMLLFYFVPFLHFAIFGKPWSFYSFEKRSKLS